MSTTRASLAFFLLALVGCGGSGGPAGSAAGVAGSTGGASAGAGGASGGRGGSGGAAAGAGGTAGTSGAAGATGGSTAGAAGTAGASGAGGGAGASAAGSGGGAGRGGVGGAAGTAGTAGSAGTAGTAGSAGTAGTAGAAGAAGTAGAGGASGRGGAAGASSSGLRLEYATSSAAATLFDLRLTNQGPSTPLISAIKLRYYFSNDDSPQASIPTVIDSARWAIANPAASIDLKAAPGCSVISTVRPVPTPSYFDINCGLTSPLGVGDVLSFTIRIDSTIQNPSNDYSYLNTAGALASNDHLLVIVNGVVVSGTAPP